MKAYYANEVNTYADLIGSLIITGRSGRMHGMKSRPGTAHRQSFGFAQDQQFSFVIPFTPAASDIRYDIPSSCIAY